jgi:hypothetical protein
MPAYHAVRLGPASVSVPDDGDGTVTVSALGDALVELVPGHARDSYTFEAEVRQRPSTEGAVGLYFLHEEQAAGSGREHSCWVLAFSEYPPLAGRVQCYGWRAQPPTVTVLAPRAVNLPFNPAPGTWRRLAVRVTPQEIEVFWEGQPLRTIPRAEVDLAGRRLADPSLDGSGTPEPRFAPRQPCGLYVSRSAASFRRAALDPRPN